MSDDEEPYVVEPDCDDWEEDNERKLHLRIYTELENHEYFKECVDSAKKIGSITLDLSHRVEFGKLKSEDYIYLASQLIDSNIENIDLGNFSLDDDELTRISEVLKHTNIQNLNLISRNFHEEGLSALSSALKETKIEFLNLSYYGSLMIPGDEIYTLINSLPFSNVTSLNLGYNKLYSDCYIQLSDALASTKITVLSLRSCNITAKGIGYLSTKLSSSKIESLDLANNKMYFDSLKSLADVLENTAITELIISSCGIDSTGAKYLAEKLRKSVLQHLDIGGNQIKSEGCLAIGNVIHLTQIIKLDLNGNLIDSSGITSLAENLKKSNVKHLNLDRNNLEINGAQDLANGMKDSKLEYLSVDNNKLSNVGMGMILDALQFTKITDFDLDCESNEMKVENMKFITNAFKCLKLKKLNLILPRDENIVLLFFNELKTLIESDNLDEILPIKNKMNFLIDFNFRNYQIINVEYILDVIKHFYMKKLILNDDYINFKSSIFSIVKMLMNITNPISNITTLDLGGNDCEDEGVIILAKNFKYLKITRLELNGCRIKNAGVIAIADELKNSQIRYLSLASNLFDSVASSYLINVVKSHPVLFRINRYIENGFSAEEQFVIKNMNYMFLKAQLLVRSISDNSPVKYDKDLIEHIRAYEIFKNVDLIWQSTYYGEQEYDYDRIDSQIRSKVTRNFLKIIGVVNSDVINSNLLPTEIIIMICSYLKINDIKFD